MIDEINALGISGLYVEDLNLPSGVYVNLEYPLSNGTKVCFLRASLNIQRAVSGEKIFRQSKQKSARIVHPIRRIFVTNDGKDAADSPCDEFLEPPLRNEDVKVIDL